MTVLTLRPTKRSPRAPKDREAARLVGRTLVGNYWIRNIVGTGGNGIVYEADDLRRRCRVVVKVPKNGTVSPLTLMRFRREARAGSLILHPNVSAFFDFGFLDESMPFIVMERLVGETLAARLSREGALPLHVAIDIMTQALAGLGAAHARGIVHRDMKPANIFLSELGDFVPLAKVLDFGSSIFNEPEADSEPEANEITELLTAVGTAVGTPRYMSPEQVCGHRDFDPRVDVFACGMILYEIVTGEAAFQATSARALFRQIIESSPPPASSRKAGLPRTLDYVLSTAMAPDREDRYPSVEAFAAALEAFRTTVPTPVMSWAPTQGETDTDAKRIAYLQSRFRELAALHRGGSHGNTPEPLSPSTNTLEIPITYEDSRSSGLGLPTLVPADEDPDGTAPTKPKRNELRRSKPSLETATEKLPPRSPKGSRHR